MRTKLISISLAFLLAIGCGVFWLVSSERQDAEDRRAKFFGSQKDLPTSGGEKMKVEW